MSSPLADRNLLFAVLALQNELVAQGDLLAAMDAWTLDKDWPLGDMLLERGVISPADRAFVGSLVERRIGRYGSTAQTLAALDLSAHLRHNLSAARDADLKASLAAIPEGTAAPETSHSIGPPPAGARYRLLRPHAEGSLEDVFIAQDLEVPREVALKEIRKELADDEASRARFVQEAKTTGGLEHSCIAPVYGLGNHADGRPYYAMRFIRGENLKAAGERFHSAERPRFDSLEFRRLVRRLLDACNAVAYAHGRGVLHRDLKPANIMLGKFGETLVLDWTGAQIAPSPYMSPEQARSDLDELGPATDVYSLGAMLYTLLTNQPPFPGLEAAKIPSLVLRGEVEWKRRTTAGEPIPPPLLAICQKAMALRSSDRYGSVLELAADLERWLADEPVSVDHEPLDARARRWWKRHPALATTAIAALLIGEVVFLGGLIFERGRIGQLTEASTQLSKANAALEATVDREKLERERLEEDGRIAQAVRHFLQRDLLRQIDAWDQADRLLKLGAQDFTVAENPSIGVLLDGAAEDLAAEKLDQRFRGQPRIQSEILATVGDSYRSIGNFSQAIEILERARALCEQARGKDDLGTLKITSNLAAAYRGAGKHNLASSLDERSLKKLDVSFGSDHHQTLASMHNLATAYLAARKFDLALPLFEQLLERQKKRLGDDHLATLLAMNNLAYAFQAAGKFDLAEPLFQETLERRSEQQGPDHSDTLTCMNNLAYTYQAARKLDLAVPLYEQTLQMQKEKLGPEHTDTLSTMSNLAAAYLDAGKFDQAVPLYEEALEGISAALRAEHPKTLSAMFDLADAYWADGQFEKSLALEEEALERQRRKLGSNHPETFRTTLGLAAAYRATGRFDKALPLYEQALTKRRQELGADHQETRASMYKLAITYLDAGQPNKGLPLFAEVLPKERLARGAESSDFATLLHDLGVTLSQGQHFSVAEGFFQECLSIRERTEPDAWSTCDVKSELGGALLAQKKFAEAEPLLVSGGEGLLANEQTIPPNERGCVAESVKRLVELYKAWDKPVEAAKWRKELEARHSSPRGASP